MATPKLCTFEHAQKFLLDVLEHGRANGLECDWTLRRDLKVPHATSEDGSTRLWFKPQAVYAGPATTLGDARSLHLDPRTTSTQKLVIWGIRLAAELRAEGRTS